MCNDGDKHNNSQWKFYTKCYHLRVSAVCQLLDAVFLCDVPNDFMPSLWPMHRCNSVSMLFHHKSISPIALSKVNRIARITHG